MGTLGNPGDGTPGNERTPVPELGLIPAPKEFRDAEFEAQKAKILAG